MMKHLHSFALLGIGSILTSLLFGGCQAIDRNGTDSCPQIYFGILQQTVVKDQEVKIPVIIQESPSGEISVGYTIDTQLASEEYEIRPEKLTFGPGRASDTVYITSRSDRTVTEDLTLRLSSVPEGYRLGVVSFIDVEFVAPMLISFKSLSYDIHKEGFLTVNLKNTQGSLQRALEDLVIDVNFDRQNSTAVEDEHVAFPDGKTVKIKKGEREGTLRIRHLKHEAGHDNLRLSLVTSSNTVLGQNPTASVTLQEPYDFTGIWMFAGSNIPDYFSGMWGLESGTYPPVDGAEGDMITIMGDSDNLDFTFDLKSSLTAFFPAASKGAFVREFINDEFEGQEITAYMLDGINAAISPNVKDIRPAEVGFTFDGEMLYIHVYDCKPAEYFSDTYMMMDDGTFEMPLIGFHPVYYFMKAE